MTSKEITSLQHPLVKHLVKLRQDRDYRYECGRILLSGIKLINELPPAIRLRTLFLEIGATSSLKADHVFNVTPEILKKVTGLNNPELIAAEIDMPAPGDLSSANFLLIFDGISDPGNLGTLLRSARALGWDGVFLTNSSADPLNEKAIRAAKGATFTLPWKCGTLNELFELLKQKKMTLLAADASGNDLMNCKAIKPLALALGNEAHGLSPQLTEIAKLIAIPMRGQMESLNVAAAGAILMYALRN